MADQRVISLRGAPRFLVAPLIVPTDAWFPDAWTPDANGVQRALQRLIGYAGLNLRVAVRIDREHDPDHAVAWFEGITEDRVARFTCRERILGDPRSLVGVLAHEAAHAWRRYERIEDTDRDTEELLTDLTTVYLGFGVLTSNSAFRVRTDAGGWNVGQAGYLKVGHFALLLGAQAVCRDMGWCDRRRLAAEMDGTQSGLFKAAFRHLVSPRGYLRYRLGLPSDWTPPPADLQRMISGR